ncbi:MAG: triose-phosphate isomerase [Eggerthellaceae bacterium]|jgi:triosephosphate isomerase
MTRRPMMAGNWKMHKTTAEAVVLAQEISNRYFKDWSHHMDIVVCPPAVDLKQVYSVFEFDKDEIFVGAQNVHWEPEGAFTGEISVRMLSEIGCTHCIVGHSERRAYFAETNETVNLKVKALLEGGLHPIICVGESLAVRDEGKTNDFICPQVRAALAGVEEADAKDCVIAYEPIWAIGTGRTATPEQAEDACLAIRQTIAEIYSQETADEMRILYGGSMKPANVEGLMAQEDIDGGLVGGASLDADSFVDLIKACL